MSPVLKHALAVTSVLALGGCGLSEDSKDNVTNPDLPDLVGTWQSNCAEAAVLDLAQTVKSLEFEGVSGYLKREAFFADGTCAQPGLEQITTGTYTLEGKLESDQSLEKINFNVDSVTLTPRSDQMVTTLETANFCGVTDWTKDIATDITGKECLGVSSDKGDVIFDVYRLQGNELRLSEKFLFLAPDSGDERPTSVSNELVYIKK